MVKGTIIISSLFIWLILIGITLFVFFIAFTFLMQYRKKDLSKIEKSIMENVLRTDPASLGDMNEIISEKWNQRADNPPIPELKIVAKGWAMDEKGEYFSYKEEIVNSFKEIEKVASQINNAYARKPSTCPRDYLIWLSKQKGIHLEEDSIDAYMSFFDFARYGPPTFNFNDEDFVLFKKSRDEIFNGVSRTSSLARRASTIHAEASLHSIV